MSTRLASLFLGGREGNSSLFSDAFSCKENLDPAWPTYKKYIDNPLPGRQASSSVWVPSWKGGPHLVLSLTVKQENSQRDLESVFSLGAGGPVSGPWCSQAFMAEYPLGTQSLAGGGEVVMGCRTENEIWG